MRLLVIIFGFLLLPPLTAQAHYSRTGYLQIEQLSDTDYQVRWLFRSTRGKVEPLFPRSCEQRPLLIENAVRLACPQGLEGEEIRLQGLHPALPEVMIRMLDLQGRERTGKVSQAYPAWRVPEQMGWWQALNAYVLLGLEHIWAGTDHLLFVLALFVLAQGMKPLLWVITAFTIGHSISLALSALGWIHVPVMRTEAWIAASLVITGVELVQARHKGLPDGKTLLLIALPFGLVHGLGFANALRETGLSEQYLGISLLGFNLGVELGQLLFVLLLLGVKVAVSKLPLVVRPAAAQVYLAAGLAVGIAGSIWLFERLARMGAMG